MDVGFAVLSCSRLSESAAARRTVDIMCASLFSSGRTPWSRYSRSSTSFSTISSVICASPLPLPLFMCSSLACRILTNMRKTRFWRYESRTSFLRSRRETPLVGHSNWPASGVASNAEVRDWVNDPSRAVKDIAATAAGQESARIVHRFTANPRGRSWGGRDVLCTWDLEAPPREKVEAKNFRNRMTKTNFLCATTNPSSQLSSPPVQAQQKKTRFLWYNHPAKSGVIHSLGARPRV